ncbi:hypothetical protein BJY52DRAFT_888061 [Lactarius psammicola]|nr:hypothetical protein BJY52DRAFT_888061 [Lactarius psammicola]
MPVLETLGYWSTLPFLVNFGGSPALDPPAPEDQDDITAALTRSGRVSSISLTVTNLLLDKFSAIVGLFSELEDLVLLSQENVQLTLPSTFRRGSRLRSLHLTRIDLAALPQLFHPPRNLVDLRLHEVLDTWHISPETLVNALSGMTQLRSLSLDFLSCHNYLELPSPSEQRIVLPALVYLNYRGTSKYLDSLVARIGALCLGDIDTTFFSQPTMCFATWPIHRVDRNPEVT